VAKPAGRLGSLKSIHFLVAAKTNGGQYNGRKVKKLDVAQEPQAKQFVQDIKKEFSSLVRDKYKLIPGRQGLRSSVKSTIDTLADTIVKLESAISAERKEMACHGEGAGVVQVGLEASSKIVQLYVVIAPCNRTSYPPLSIAVLRTG
jgi:hypothetical protein